MPKRLLITGAIVATLLGAPVALACAFHTYLPERTVVDRLLETDQVVLARPVESDPFRFAPVEVLVDGGRAVEIAQLVDSTTRRRLANAPDETVVFAYDAETDGWARLGYMDESFAPVVAAVIEGRSRWQPGYDPARLALFAGLQDNPDLRQLVLRELDQVPYAQLRGIEMTIPVEELLDGLWSPQGYAYQPISVLLLGLSGEERARVEIRGFIDRVESWDRAQNLGPYATALVELDGVEGILQLEAELLSDPAQPLDKLEQVVEALAIHHGIGSDELRTRIEAALSGLVEMRPEAAAAVARQLGTRQDWSQAKVLEAMMARSEFTSPAVLLPVASYVAMARQAGSVGQ